MKNYTEYMDNLSVDAALHEKIMKRVTQKSVPLYRFRSVTRFAGLTACAAVLLLCVWTIPGLFNAPTPNIPNNPGVMSSGSEQAGTVTNPPSDSNTVIPGFPDKESPLCALTLNKADSQTAASIHIPGHFWYGLTDEQLKAVLPDLQISISATVHYRGDGSIFSVAAYEISDNGDIARFNELYALTEIQFAPGEIVDDVIYDYDAKISDVYGIPVIAGVFDGNKNDGVAFYIASFKIGEIAYNVKLHDDDNSGSGLTRLIEIVNAIVRNGAADLSVLSDPVIPELRDEKLTLDEARNDPDFGVYLPKNFPSRFVFETAHRFINQGTNSLTAYWFTGYDSINWSISRPNEYDREHIVSASEREKYDLSLYPIPQADSVPSELREYVDNPVFPADELTLDVIEARAYYVDNDRGDSPGWRMDFSVLFDDVVIHVNIKGASPEQVWEMFAELMRN